MSHHEHRAAAEGRVVRCVVITVSDTRTDATDSGGRAIVELLTAAGFACAGKVIVKDDPAAVAALVREHTSGGTVDVVITTGGTGISRRDTTFEAVDAMFDKRLPGFGELFRMLSFADIGPAAMLSRAAAGTVDGRLVVMLPGSEAAVRLAMTRLLVPELPHVVRELTR
jgi:molybdenum cofactor biosynthesis protein B